MPLTRVGRAAAALTLCASLAACSSGDPATPSASPNPTPSASPSASPLAPGEMPPRLVGADDATLLEAAERPRTGEVWLTEPDDLEPAVPILASDSRYFTVHVGSRGSTEIYLVVDEWDPYNFENMAVGLVEIRDDGAHLVASPFPQQASCEGPGIAATEVSGYFSSFDPDVAVDCQVFYDSLGWPRMLSLGEGVDVPLGDPWRVDQNGRSYAILGSAWSPIQEVGSPKVGPPDDWQILSVEQMTTVAEFGGWSVFSWEDSGPYEGLMLGRLLLVSPIGTSYGLGGQAAYLEGLAPDAEDIDWASGFEPVAPEGLHLQDWYVPAGLGSCDFSSSFAREVDHLDTEWRSAGKTNTSGTDVYIPLAGGNTWSETFWIAHYDNGEPNWEGEIQPFSSEESFLAANSLIATQGPNGDWYLWLLYTAGPPRGSCY